MDSVYDAALNHAEELKAELEKLQTFLDLHDHFRGRFGLTPPSAPSQATPAEVKAPIAEASVAEAPIAEASVAQAPVAQGHVAQAPGIEAAIVDQAAATHEIHVQEPAVQEPAVARDPGEAYVEAPVEAQASEPEAIERPESVQSAQPVPDEAAATAETEPRVIQASEGVLIPTSSDADVDAPLGPEATLQSVAEKLAATIGASHPSVTGYTV